MTLTTPWSFKHDPFDIVWKNFFDVESTFNTIKEKINYPVDIYETDKGLRFELAAVGLEREDLEITIETGTLRVSYKKPAEDTSSIKYIQKSIVRRAFDLAWKVSSAYDVSKVSAKLEKGILIMDIPFAEEQQVSKVKIQ